MNRSLVCLCATALATYGPAEAQCPPELHAARHLLLVAADATASPRASFRRFERSAPGQPWRPVGGAAPAVVGATGLGWPPGASHDNILRLPRKTEGDKRTPAGFFSLGRPFGFAASPRPDYLRLVPGQAICVDDPASPLYGRIVSPSEHPGAHGEDMGRVSLYRRGFVIDYPVDAAERSGSCIFLHVWRAAGKGTVGCVALSEADVEAVQAWARPGDVIGILPQREAEAALACLKTP